MNFKRTILYASWLPENSGNAEIVSGLQEELAFEGYCLLVPPRAPDERASIDQVERERILRCLTDREIAGLVLLYNGDAQNLELVRQLQNRGKAVVLIERMPDAYRNFDWVGIDNVMAARQVVEHLIAQGHRSIAHITTNEAITSVRDRHRGYRQALERAGLCYRAELVVPHGSDNRGIAIPAELLHSLRSLPDPPTAIFALHDWAGLLTMTTAHLNGINVPQQLAVAGFDGIERSLPDKPVLTTAEVPFFRLGTQAARLVIDRLAGRTGNSVRHVSLEAPLRVRFSTQKDTSISLLDASLWRARVVYHYMLDNLERVMTADELARVAGVSASTLCQDFQQKEKKSPMQVLAALRMEQVRWELTHPKKDTTISSCLARCGVNHQGRFASAYREIYGETPSDTLRRTLDGRNVGLREEPT